MYAAHVASFAFRTKYYDGSPSLSIVFMGQILFSRDTFFFSEEREVMFSYLCWRTRPASLPVTLDPGIMATYHHSPLFPRTDIVWRIFILFGEGRNVVLSYLCLCLRLPRLHLSLHRPGIILRCSLWQIPSFTDRYSFLLKILFVVFLFVYV